VSESNGSDAPGSIRDLAASATVESDGVAIAGIAVSVGDAADSVHPIAVSKNKAVISGTSGTNGSFIYVPETCGVINSGIVAEQHGNWIHIMVN